MPLALPESRGAGAAPAKAVRASGESNSSRLPPTAAGEPGAGHGADARHALHCVGEFVLAKPALDRLVLSEICSLRAVTSSARAASTAAPATAVELWTLRLASRFGQPGGVGAADRGRCLVARQ